VSDDVVAVVTGGNRGLGLEVVRQLGERPGHTVYLGSRDSAKGHAAAQPLIAAGLDVRPVPLDVTDPAAADALAAHLEAEHGRLDVLVNNAAIHYDTWQAAITADLGVVREALETNVLGAWQLTERLAPLLRRSDHGRIVNVSSGGGSLTEMGGGIPAYRVSKAALNALTRMWADELRRDRVLVNSICPGWVATDMGGPGGRPVDEGAAGITWAATLPDDGPTGGFFRDRQPVPW
jgi:NAD(P)-dependent dehydrogenase (short-subunit alcohol dehydrogenase family)